MSYIVNIQAIYDKNIWLAPWEGDPGRTLKKENAKIFTTKLSAQRAINKAIKNYPRRLNSSHQYKYIIEKLEY